MATKLGAVAGIIFAVMLVVGLMATGTPPSGEDTDDQVIAWHADSGNQKQQLASAYMLTVAGLALVVFVGIALKPTLASRNRNESDSALVSITGSAALLAAAAFVIGAFAIAAVSGQGLFQDEPIDAGVARFLPSMGYGLVLIGGGLAGAVMITAASMHALRTGSLPVWLGWLGILCALVLLAAVIFLPLAALPLWAIVVSVVLLMRKDAARA